MCGVAACSWRPFIGRAPSLYRNVEGWSEGGHAGFGFARLSFPDASGDAIVRPMRDLFEAGSALRRLSDDDRAAIARSGHRRTFRPGQTVLKEGAAGDGMFVVQTGEVALRLPYGEPIVLGPGTYFGELSFINPDHPRSADVIARTSTELLELDQGSIAALQRTHPQVLLKLVRRTCAFLVDKETSLVSALRVKNAELEQTLDFLRRTREELDYQELLAQTDGLTGLYNRRCLDEQLPKFIRRTEGVGLVMVDLDHFKPVNDTLGHPAGDLVLCGVARVLRRHVRRTDLPVRLGGDEFCVVFNDVDEAQGRRRAEDLRAGIEVMPQPGQDHGILVTASMGGAIYERGEAVEAFVERADAVLYEAKRAGRNCLRWAR